MSDLVQRLRDYTITGHNPDGPPPIKFHSKIADEAADEIEHLRAALKEIADACERASHPAAPVCLTLPHVEHLQQIASKARAVVQQTNDKDWAKAAANAANRIPDIKRD